MREYKIVVVAKKELDDRKYFAQMKNADIVLAEHPDGTLTTEKNRWDYPGAHSLFIKLPRDTSMYYPVGG